MANQKVYELITDKMVETIESSGQLPWHKPWKTMGVPRNYQSKRPYRGINAFILAFAPYSSPFWTTMKAANKLGGRVRKGEKATYVIFWKAAQESETYLDDDGTERKRRPFMLRYYKVFNVSQIEWPDHEQEKIDALHDEIRQIEFEPHDEAQRILNEWETRPMIFHESSRAAYNWREDVIELPDPDTFESVEAYYSTRFHESAHATGHESRLHRVKDWSTFGSDPYGKEELVAEMTAAFLCGVTGIEGQFDESAGYLSGWLKKIQGDPKLLVQAAAQAQKAADHILNINFDKERESSETPAQEVAIA